MDDNTNIEQSNLESINKKLDNITKILENQEKRLETLEDQNQDKSYEISNQNNFQQNTQNQNIKEGIPVMKIEPNKEVIKSNNVMDEKKPKQFDDNLETEIGSKWLVRIGIVALTIGMVFFLKYAFDNWIGPIGQILVSYLVGIIIIGIGFYLKNKYFKYSQILMAGGTAILYITTFAAYDYHQIIGAYVAFFIFALIVIFNTYLSVRFNSQPLAYLGLIGGFVSPYLININVLGELIIISYLLLLNTGVLYISYKKNWWELTFASMIATYFSIYIWAAENISVESFNFTISIVSVFFLFYILITLVKQFIKKKRVSETDIILIILNGLIYYLISITLINQRGMPQNIKNLDGSFSIFLALFYTILSIFAYLNNRDDRKLTLSLVSLSVFFAVIAIPQQFDRQWITIAWATLAITLIWLGFKANEQVIRVLGYFLYIVAILKLLFFDIPMFLSAGNQMSPDRIFTMGAITLLTYLGAYLIVVNKSILEKHKDELSIIPAAVITTQLLTLITISLEINQYFKNNLDEIDKIIYADRRGISPNGNVIDRTLELTKDEKSNLRIQYSNILFMKNLTLSLFWITYAYLLTIISKRINRKYIATFSLVIIYYVIAKVLMFDIFGYSNPTISQNFLISFVWSIVAVIGISIGFYINYKEIRVAGLILLGMMIFKLFLFDTWQLEEIYRILAYIILGLLLIGIGFIYVKYQERIKETWF